MEITLDRQIACVRREIAMRRRVYPHWVESKKMTQAKADEEIVAMEAVLETLVRLIEGAANARLMAAAPDLLDALKALLVYPDRWCCCTAEQEAAGHTGECLQAQAAIAKATGGES